MMNMNITNLYFILDSIQEEEMKTFETKRMDFSSCNIIKRADDIGKIEKRFIFTTDQEFDIHICLYCNEFMSVFFVNIELGAYKNNGWSPGLEQVLLHEYIEEIEPIVLFLQQKKTEIEQRIQKTLPATLGNEKELRLTLLMDPEKIIQVVDHATQTYTEVVDFKNDSNFEKNLEERRRQLKERGRL